jgi:hypothetical protein
MNPSKNNLEDFWRLFGYPEPQKEFRFHPERKWRFDFAFPDRKIAVEVQGGLFIGGAHARPTFIVQSYEKMNNAMLLGWKVFQFQPKEFNNGIAVEILDQIFGVQRYLDGNTL